MLLPDMHLKRLTSDLQLAKPLHYTDVAEGPSSMSDPRSLFARDFPAAVPEPVTYLMNISLTAVLV
jgi:hypothetical protein